MTEPNRPAAPPTENYGAGYLYHYDSSYQQFADQLDTVGGEVDIYEVLGVQFNSEPDSLDRFAESLGKPITLHAYETCLGNVDRPCEAMTNRVVEFAKRCGAVYIGEHVGVMGTKNYYTGGFIQPPGTDEQTEVLIRNVEQLARNSPCPVLLENASQFYRPIGPRSIAQQLTEVAAKTSCGIILSLSNILISEHFLPQDREQFLAEIDLRLVRQLHVFLNNYEEEQTEAMRRSRDNQQWMLRMLEHLASDADCSPASVIFELEADTDAMTEPERLRDCMQMARELFFRGEASAA